MPRKLPNKDLFDPKRARIRQAWHPFNLYNLFAQPRSIARSSDGFFKKKWTAKAATRAYHGEQVPEHRWEKMFSRYIPAVVPMYPRFLATSDGTGESGGRGSGLAGTAHQNSGSKKADTIEGETPYMQMTFWPLERRLDTAIHRALFAASIRQARQMVIHGHVKVNGKRMIHPGYLLNPGDLFSVDVDTVLWATGLPKSGKQQEMVNDKDAEDSLESEETEAELAPEIEEVVEELDDYSTDLKTDASDSTIIKENKASLENVRQIIDEIIEKVKPSVKRKQELRAIRKQIRPLISKIKKDETASEIQSLETSLQEVLEKIEVGGKPAPSGEEGLITRPGQSAYDERKERGVDPDGHLSSLAKAYNEFLPDKSYAQPWQPRDWMAPFAFVPRYLEVNYNICSAVYLRHPVARPGQSEVPSPFPLEAGVLAHNWYLRRR